MAVNDGVSLFATPDWDEHDTLPVQVETSDGLCLSNVCFVVCWERDLELDARTFELLVASVIQDWETWPRQETVDPTG